MHLQKEQQVKRREERLSKLHLITSVDELQSKLVAIDQESSISVIKKTKKKLSLIREQIKIRKKVLEEKVNIPFSCKGKQIPLSTIINEFSTHLQSTVAPSSTGGRKYSSEALVGKSILHKFEVDGQEEWFRGLVVGYNAQTNEHEISYEAEEDQRYFFNLLEDISHGDLVVTSQSD